MEKCEPCRVITVAQLRDAVHEAYEATKDITGGKNASYIPYLADVDPTLFALCVTLGDGTVISVGDDQSVFGIESVSKVPTAVLAMK